MCCSLLPLLHDLGDSWYRRRKYKTATTQPSAKEGYFAADRTTDWTSHRGPDSLRYHYPEETVQYILKRRAEKRAKALEKEVIDLTGDSD